MERLAELTLRQRLVGGGLLAGAALFALYRAFLRRSDEHVGDALFRGIAQLYNESTDLWESQWKTDHLHTGHYGADGRGRMTLVEAQENMIEQLLALGGVKAAGRVLDVGCGLGGSARNLASRFACQVDAVTLSERQVERGRELNVEAGLQEAVTMHVANALDLPFADETFDVVWSLESGEHIPHKERWLKEVHRVLKPGGKFLCATWCHREVPPSLTAAEEEHLATISYHYFLPKWVPLSHYKSLCSHLKFSGYVEQDWTTAVLPFWPAVVRSCFWPSSLIGLALAGTTTIKGAWTSYLMMTGFSRGILVFGAFAVHKPAA